MKISHCNQLLAISTLLSGVLIIATLWQQYQSVERISRDHVNARLLVQTTEHLTTMSQIWLTTQDLLFSGKQTYLANGINEQSSQLVETLQTIKLQLSDKMTISLVQQLITQVQQNNDLVHSFSQMEATDNKALRNIIDASDMLTTEFVNQLDEMSQQVDIQRAVLSSQLKTANKSLSQLAWVVTVLYVIFILFMVTWFSKYIVKPLENITYVAKNPNVNQDTIRFTQSQAPLEIITLSLAIEQFTQRITVEKQKLEQERINVLSANKKINTIMDTIPCSLLLLDNKGVITESNNETQTLLSKSHSEIVGKNISEFIPALATLNGVFDKEMALRSMQESLLSPSFKHPHIEFSGRNISLSGVDNYLLTITDINDRKHSQKALSALNEQLVNAEKLASVGQLSAGIAHEINNPIGYVRSNLDILKDYIDSLTRYIAITQSTKVETSVEQAYKKEDIDYIIKDVEPLMSSALEGIGRVSKIIKDLGSYVHVDNTEPEPICIDELISQSLTLVANELKYKVEITTALNANVNVVGFPQKLLQVFINMLVNASHAIEKQGHINIRSDIRNGEVAISFEDDGSGMSQENLKRIFDPFFTTKPVGKGTGLGLHIVRSIIDEHQGRIEVSSTKGKGSKFDIYLPILVTSKQKQQAEFSEV